MCPIWEGSLPAPTIATRLGLKRLSRLRTLTSRDYPAVPPAAPWACGRTGSTTRGAVARASPLQRHRLESGPWTKNLPTRTCSLCAAAGSALSYWSTGCSNGSESWTRPARLRRCEACWLCRPRAGRGPRMRQVAGQWAAARRPCPREGQHRGRRPCPRAAGATSLASRPARADAPLVGRLRAAGAIILGTTNLSEWANIRSPRSTSGWSAVGGLTGNPWALDRSPGGSSSGSGAAVAAGLAPLAVGTETDGSITCPASLNGVGRDQAYGGLGPDGRRRSDQRQPGQPGADGPHRRRSGAALRGAQRSPGILDRARQAVTGTCVSRWHATWRTGHPGDRRALRRGCRRLAAAGAALHDVSPAEPRPPADGEDELTVLLCELVDELGRLPAHAGATMALRTSPR